MVFYYRILAKANEPLTSILKLRGLDEEKDYMLLGTDQVYGGDELMYAGLVIPELKGDFVSAYWRFRVE